MALAFVLAFFVPEVKLRKTQNVEEILADDAGLPMSAMLTGQQRIESPLMDRDRRSDQAGCGGGHRPPIPDAVGCDDVIEKSPGDVVTTADRECEQLLVAALADVAPGVPVLGEEAASADPDATKGLLARSSLFVVDPLDGTRAFVAGSPDFAVMVARVEDGVTTHAWIWHPMHNVMWTAELGAGTWRNGVRQTRAPATDAAKLRGAVKTGFRRPDSGPACRGSTNSPK